MIGPTFIYRGIEGLDYDEKCVGSTDVFRGMIDGA
jgi:hypothetical protein